MLCLPGKRFGTFSGLNAQERPFSAAERSVPDIRNSLVVNAIGQQTDALRMVAADKITEAARKQHGPDIARPDTSFLKQDRDAGANGAGAQLNLANVPLDQHDRF